MKETCELCQDTGLIEIIDMDGYPTGEYRKCAEHIERDNED